MRTPFNPEWFARLARDTVREGIRQGVAPAEAAFGVLRPAAELGPDYLLAVFQVAWEECHAANRSTVGKLWMAPPSPRRPGDDATGECGA